VIEHQQIKLGKPISTSQ